MAIYIKGMEMPKVCYECKMLDDHYDYPYCIITGEQRGCNFRTRERRMDNCPLTEIPEPHGRLIDAGQLCKGLDERWTTANKNAEKAIADVIADVVVPILVSTPTVIEGSE